MRGRDGVVATTVHAALWILLAAAAVGGVLELADLVSGTGAVGAAHQTWLPLGAVIGLLRVVLLAALGAAVTAAVLTLDRRLRRGTPRRAR